MNYSIDSRKLSLQQDSMSKMLYVLVLLYNFKTLFFREMRRNSWGAYIRDQDILTPSSQSTFLWREINEPFRLE